jgi:hypothetical protein
MKYPVLPVSDPHAGYSDEDLEKMSRLNSRYEGGIAPWATWESENSSFGKTFRTWALYPRILPLFISSDHGVHWGATCWPTEVNNRYNTYFSWNRKKAERLRNLHQKNAYYVPHPWVHYRKKFFSKLPADRSGTLVFYAHSNNNTTPVYKDLDGYIEALKSLPTKYQPLTFCLSFHDIAKGLHKTLRKHGIPLVTAGTTNSQDFVDRFYSLTSHFRYATSPNVGTHTYYLLESGIPFFLFGDHPSYQIKGSQVVKDGAQNISDYGDAEDQEQLERLKTLLTEKQDEVTPEQYQMVSEYMGLSSGMSRLHASWILWREFILHLPDYVELYLSKIHRFIKKIHN